MSTHHATILTGTRTQDLIFTLYGDYLHRRDGTAWVGSLIELMATLGASEQAVRSTVSRMARNGWLSSEKRGRNSYYSLTRAAVQLLDKGTQQIFSPPQDDWRGNWFLVTYSFSSEQDGLRHELRKHLTGLGFGQLSNGVWLSPRDQQDDVNQILDDLRIAPYVDTFRAEHLYSGSNAHTLAQRCWDLTELNAQYTAFVETYQPAYERDCIAGDAGEPLSLAYAFEQRFWLVHEYRYFPFHDPYLPAELLPEDWRGHEAVSLFQAYQTLLKERANAYVDHVLSAAP